jgi:hypothetical protein
VASSHQLAIALKNVCPDNGSAPSHDRRDPPKCSSRTPRRHSFRSSRHNYDELIELTFKAGGAEIEVSVTAEEFRAHQPAHPDRHLIKLHGTISRPETIVVTRDDYAASR